MKGKPLLIIGVLLFLVVGAVVWRVVVMFSSMGGGGWDANAPVIADSVRVAIEDVDATYAATGTVEADQMAELRAEIPARVTKILFKEGQFVGKGQVLIQLDSAEQQANLQESAARVQAAKGAVTQTRLDLARLEADLNSYKARLDLAQNEYDRYKDLYEKDFISALELEQKRTALKTAEADYAAQRKANEASQAAVEQSKANLGSSQALYQSTAVQRNRTQVVAPFDGVVGARQVDVGDYVRSGDMLTTVVDVTPLKIRFDIPQRYLGNIDSGARVSVYEKESQGKAPVTGRVNFIDPAVSADNRAVQVKAILDNTLTPLKPGQFMEVSLVFEQHPDALVIPEEALVPRGEQEFVYRVDGDGVAHLQKVTVGERMPGKVEVLEGLSKTDTVVVSGLQKIQDGSKVLSPEAAAKAAAVEKESSGDADKGE